MQQIRVSARIENVSSGSLNFQYDTKLRKSSK